MIIQKLRIQHGWSQQQLAELSGLSVRTIQRIEQGQQTTSVESLKSLAAVFNVDFSTLRPQEKVMDNQSNNSSVSIEEALALNHIQNVKKFYIHLGRYVIVIALLSALNYLKTPNHLWVIWVAVGWGIGLTLQGMRIFTNLLGPEWERKQVEKYLGKKL